MKKILYYLTFLLALGQVSIARADIDIGTVDLPWKSSSTTILDFLAKIINWFLAFVGIAAFAALIYAGILYITAGGDTAKTEAAKKTVTWAITGMIICLLSYLIISFVIKVPTTTP